jgi:hypothetical protein
MKIPAVIVLIASFVLAFAPAGAKDIGYYLQTGEPVAAGQFTPKDGVVRVSKKGSPIDGFEIVIPSGSYEQPPVFTVSYRLIRKYQVPDHVISPLITVTGLQEPAKGYLIVKIPCKVPENSNALIFFYDEQEKFTRALPAAPKQAGYVTGMTRVFKDMVVVAQKINRGGAPVKK